ncbi:hypothetical protein HCN44_006658 [Aphidius gifuensis]|uniref:Protoporphyrinogen oxidase n=1 Tax=Aphidius gifuensis TaxID=684658 RepID=A0A834Y2X2_APHGI|nr:protoporphyrinogen oxidase [Aphidius gifuensis]KAF7995551.1 hypothetical protein HCN44_006658 [Aphidius gifuensis]
MTAILGGGIGGLSAAYYALENPKLGPLIIYEASDRIGGWIKSNRSQKGILFEKGPRTVRTHGPPGANTLRMIDDIGLTDKILPISSKHPIAKNRLIYVDNKLHILPNSVGSFFKVKSPFKRPLITMLWNDFKAPKVIKNDESIYSFVERRFGKDAADYLISPMLCGICAGDAKKISVNFLMEALFEAEQEHGSIMKGLLKTTFNNKKNNDNVFKKNNKPINFNVNSVARSGKERWVAWGLQGGLEQLPRALAENLLEKNVDISLLSKCENITFKSDHVELNTNGDTKKFKHIISSLPSSGLSKLIEHQHPELAKELNDIPTVNVTVVNLQFPKNNILPINGFGVLVPPSEKIPILGIIFDSCIYPQKTSTVLTVMMGGAWFDEYFGKNSSDEFFLNTAVEHVKKMLNIKIDPTDFHVGILNNCIPQYVVGHKDRIKRIHNYINQHGLPLSLCGSAYQGVGLNDVILSAKNAVQNIC